MKDTELVSALRQLKINTKGLACIGCNYGFNCHASGCRLIGIAADRLNEVGIILSIIKGMYAEAKDTEKTLLGIALSLFDRYYGVTHGIPRNTVPEKKNIHRMAYDFEICSKKVDLVAALDCINRNQWALIAITYGPNGYTLFFRRPARE